VRSEGSAALARALQAAGCARRRATEPGDRSDPRGPLKVGFTQRAGTVGAGRLACCPSRAVFAVSSGPGGSTSQTERKSSKALRLPPLPPWARAGVAWGEQWSGGGCGAELGMLRGALGARCSRSLPARVCGGSCPARGSLALSAGAAGAGGPNRPVLLAGETPAPPGLPSRSDAASETGLAGEGY